MRDKSSVVEMSDHEDEVLFICLLLLLLSEVMLHIYVFLFCDDRRVLPC